MEKAAFPLSQILPVKLLCFINKAFLLLTDYIVKNINFPNYQHIITFIILPGTPITVRDAFLRFLDSKGAKNIACDKL